MKHAILISISLLSAPAFAANPIQEAFDGHIQLLSDAGNKRDTLLTQERFAQFRSLFCDTMKNPQESAQSLYADYKSNEPATAKKIDGRPVLIHGDVLEVRASGTTGVLLKMISRDSSSDRINPLMLEIAKESHDAALKLKNLDAVDVECKTVGLDVVTLIGKECAIH